MSTEQEIAVRHTPAVTLPADFSECERGNVWLADFENGKHIAWLRLEGHVDADVWLEIEIVPDNYPGLVVNTVKLTDDELAAHIRKNLEGRVVRKLNLNVGPDHSDWLARALKRKRIPYEDPVEDEGEGEDEAEE